MLVTSLANVHVTLLVFNLSVKQDHNFTGYIFIHLSLTQYCGLYLTFMRKPIFMAHLCQRNHEFKCQQICLEYTISSVHVIMLFWDS